MARPDKWMPMYWADFWRDTAHLSEQEGWAYLNLIGAYWTNSGPLPADNSRLQRLSRCSPKVWEKVKAAVVAFFERDNNCLKHGRIDRELVKSTEAYEKRKAHVDTINERKRQRLKQSPTTVTVNNYCPQLEPQSPSHNLQPQSPNGDTEANASVGRKRPPAEKGTRLAADWKPSEENCEYGRKLGYRDDEVDAEAAEFRAYFHSANAAKPVKKSWDDAWGRWVRENKDRRIAKRASGRRSFSNRQGPGSLAAALGENLGFGDLDGQGQRSDGMGWGTNGHSTDETNADFGSEIGRGNGPEIDGTYAPIGDPEGTGEAPGVDESASGDDGRYSPVASDLRGRDGELSGGRDPIRYQDTAEDHTLVACVVGTERAA